MSICVREMCECMYVCTHHNADGPYVYVDVTRKNVHNSYSGFLLIVDDWWYK